jgi:hypothetical protein
MVHNKQKNQHPRPFASISMGMIVGESAQSHGIKGGQRKPKPTATRPFHLSTAKRGQLRCGASSVQGMVDGWLIGTSGLPDAWSIWRRVPIQRQERVLEKSGEKIEKLRTSNRA